MNYKDLLKTFPMNADKLLEMIVGTKYSYVILFKDTDSKIIYVNDRFFKKHKEFASNPDSVLGKTDFDLFPGADNEHAKQAFEDEQRVMSTGEILDVIESEGKDSLGRKKIAHTRKYPVYDNDDNVIGVIVITEDITANIETLKKTQEKNELLSELNRELTEENTLDSLTGLYNRRFIRAELNSLYDTYKSIGQLFSVILIDIDDFKHINDKYGHSTGDDVLSYIGKTLLDVKHNKFTNMLPCRYGGDEFLVILPARDIESSVAVAKFIKDKFIEPYNTDNYHETIGLSMGVATIESSDTIHELLIRCDERLYRSKQTGKDRITY